ncbi:hypothetical protein JZ751_019871 [Albula glossodonta]|uniref:Uncharacterized protein n=1 Tax=Albula glossodonta TaxID=121402 RepID=A0A8T2NXK5_9TELE|nr:hypothetical protein JZ751_019871 [Albula glossodonta]
MIPQLKESLPKVVFILVPGIVDIHLNSKNASIYSAALVAMHALIQNLDNALLLDIFVAKAQVLAGQAKADVTETVADIVMELYPHKPKMVEQEVLPLLWHLLVQSSHREATATLCRALYIHMGPKLRVCAASQPVSIVRSLDHLLNTVVES